MNIEFVKWMVSYAEGFEYREQDWIQTPGLYGYGFNLIGDDWIDPVDWRAIYDPLLLQRAIEGINKSDNKYKILQHIKRILVWDSECGLHIPEVIYKFKDFENIDTAKEEALKYIYEQETK